MRKLITISLSIIGFALIVLTPSRCGHYAENTEIRAGICNAFDLTPKSIDVDDRLTFEPVQVEVSTEEEPDNSWKVTDDEYALLALVVEAEAGDQDFIGRRLVVDVILNRVASKQFPNDIYGVIFQRNQFSTTFDGAFDRVRREGITQMTYDAIDLELQLNENRYNTEVLFFTMGYYNPYCKPMFVWGTHYFGR